jgi:hypothetical protein
MSKIEVNTITQQCGPSLTVGGGACKSVTLDATTVTLGRCGATVSLASGATQSGFGRTGTVDWCTTAKTAPFTGVSGKGYFVNTTCGAVTVTLPATPTAGDIISVKDYARTAGTNNISFCRNGSKMDGNCANGLINTNGDSTTLIYVDGTKGWTSILDNTTNTYGAAYVTATGGTIVTCGDYKIHAFTSDATFCVSNAGNPAGSDTVDYLVVAGGGGGGGSCNTVGAGGAGGFRIGAITVPGCAPALVAPGGIPVSIQAYPVTVGAGGVGGSTPTNPPAAGTLGSNSIFSTITSAGGGGGGGGNPAGPCGAYKNGGSGGGGADTSLGGTGNTPPVSPSQGNDGGDGTPPGSRAPSYGGGGGGGAGSAGVDATNTKAGDGGNGSSVTDIFGAAPKPFYAPTNGLYSGGGGGGYLGCSPPATQGLGGPGGGGPSGVGVNSPGIAGTTNTGGGGGGAADTGPYNQYGGNGGSGVVLIRYKFQN